MELLKVLPQFTEAKNSKAGFLNQEDLHKLCKNMLIFLTPTLVLYGGQLLGSLNSHTVLSLADLIPSSFVIGAFEGYLISTFMDYLKKLNAGGK